MRVLTAKAAAVIVILIAFSCEAFGVIPVTFVENRGQSYPRVRFMVKGQSGSAFFTRDAVVYNLSTKQDGDKGVGLWMRFVDAQTQALKGVDVLPGKANFINGSDRSKWQKNVPTYGGVAYRGVWPGIDIVYKSDGTSLKYDVIAAPGADINLIHLKYEGAESVSLNSSGGLVVKTAVGSFTEEKPGIYQIKNGRKVWLDGAVDANGNIYVTGATYSENFPVTPGAYDMAITKDEAYVAKLDPSGNSLIYATFIGGSGVDRARAIAVDSTGSAYLAGETSSQDFPITPGAFGTAGEALILKLNPSGSSLDYSTFLIGARIYDIAVESGCAYVTGLAASQLPVTSGAYQTTFRGGSDAFVTKLNQTGSGLVYSTYIGGATFDCGYGITVKDGAAYITGNTFSLDFPTTPDAYDRTTTGADAFIAKLDSSGSVLDFSTFLGGSLEDVGKAIAVGAEGDVFVTGYTESSNFPTTPGAYDTSFNGARDAFVAKLSGSGSSLIYSTYLGGSGNDTGKAICVDQCGSAYVTGATSSGDFPVSPGAFDTSYGGGCSDAFAVRVSPNGSNLAFSTYIGGDKEESGSAITALNCNSFVVVGDTFSPGFPVLGGADMSFDVYEAFALKLDPAVVLSIGCSPPDAGITTPPAGLHPYSPGEQVQVQVSANPGYMFDYWQGDVESPTSFSTNVIMDGSKTVKAVFCPAVTGAKRAFDGVSVQSVGNVVTAAFDDFFYIEDDERADGIRVNLTGHGLTSGMRVDVTGTVATTPDGERCIDASTAVQNTQTPFGSIAPLAMTNRELGGGDLFYQVTPEGIKGQKGILGASGLNNIGLLVRTWGRVVQTGTSSFVIDDGSGALPEVTVPAGTTMPSEDDIIVITGISSCKKVDGDLYRVVRVDRPQNITYIVKH